jgi:hypothetical protein
MHAQELIKQKNHIMKNKNITEMEIEEIKKELQENQRNDLNNSGENSKNSCVPRMLDSRSRI